MSYPVTISLGLFLASLFPYGSLAQERALEMIYSNWGALEDYRVVPECNPGDTTDYECGEQDVAIEHLRGHTSVTANPKSRLVFVNAIAGMKMTGQLADGSGIRLGRYRYTYSVRLPQEPDPSKKLFGEAIHQMILFWDGGNQLGEFDGKTLEGAIYWDINPHSKDFQHIKVYSGDPLKLIDTGIILATDTRWHRFEVRVDLEAQTYLGIVIDDEWNALKNLPLGRVAQPKWGKDLSLVLTAESENAFPGKRHSISSWTAHFKDAKFFREK